MSGKVLVAYASAMGGTAGIAEAIGDELRRRGHEVDVRDVEQVGSLDDYTVVIIGSALYARRWRRTAVRFLRRHVDELRRRQVWLFHSGPVGPDKDTVESTPRNVARLARRIGAAEPVTFAGRLERQTAKGLLAHWLAKGELEGDFRDWDQIRNWAHALHDAITAVGVSPRTRNQQWR
jgi:menaquinone-dependent protoporphyrinogen oxidase